MKTLNQIKLFIAASSLFLWQCEVSPEKLPPQYLITDTSVETPPKRALENCIIRYQLANSFTRLDNPIQQNAVKKAFDFWQKSITNLKFLQYDVADRTEILVKFVSPNEIIKTTQTASVGLVRFAITNVCMLKKEANKIPVIMLDNTYNWTEETILQATTYQIGIFLGMNTSTDQNSVMYPYLNQTKNYKLNKNDSLTINQLYSSPCKNSNFSFIPFSLPVWEEVKRDILLDKQGTVVIEAKGQIVVGILIGTSTPDGKDKGYLDITIPSISKIVPTFFHGGLMYRLDNESNWTFCGSRCEFETKGRNAVQLILQINDSSLYDNIGAYQVTVKYK